MVMTSNALILIGVLFAFAFPIALFIGWKIKTGAKLWCFIAGAICFVLFAMVFETILHQFCLMSDNAVSRAILGSPILYMLYAAFAAGIFEETGRMFGYKILLRKHKEKATAIAYGIGHGGIEVIIVLGMTYLVYLLAVSGVDFGGAEVNDQLLAAASSITPLSLGVSIFERISAMMIHIGLSMLVFVAAGTRKYFWLYPTAIVLHALVDAPAALYQYGMLPIAMVEVVTFVMGLICLLLGARVLRRVQIEDTKVVEDSMEE